MKLTTADPKLQPALALLQAHAPLFGQLPDLSVTGLPVTEAACAGAGTETV